MSEERKFIQITTMPSGHAQTGFVTGVSNEPRLFGLDNHGGVWEYDFSGKKHGWKMLPKAPFPKVD